MGGKWGPVWATRCTHCPLPTSPTFMIVWSRCSPSYIQDLCQVYTTFVTPLSAHCSHCTILVVPSTLCATFSALLSRCATLSLITQANKQCQWGFDWRTRNGVHLTMRVWTELACLILKWCKHRNMNLESPDLWLLMSKLDNDFWRQNSTVTSLSIKIEQSSRMALEMARG